MKERNRFHPFSSAEEVLFSRGGPPDEPIMVSALMPRGLALIAVDLGDGNISEGLREALRIAGEHMKGRQQS